MNGYVSVENGAQSNNNIYSCPMETTGHKVFNDSVHGHITLHPLLVKVVDTPEFQRLRNIKQLGVANYVYPGAGHSRYEHSLGTCYLAGQMVEKLMSREAQTGWERSREDRDKLSLCVQLAALCHDLGHGPFSHTWESVVHQWGGHWMHEESSLKMFDYLVEKNGLVNEFKQKGLEERERNIIKQLIMGEPENDKDRQLGKQDSFLYEIVSNKKTGIDVDKWDYFLRDGLHLNLRITFNYHRLLELCTVRKKPDGHTYVAFREKEVMNLYDMYRVRSTLHHTAYRHKVVINIEQMFIDAFKAAGDAGYILNNSGYELKEAHERPESMREMTDHIFYDILYSKDDAYREARNLFERVLKRDLYKFVGKVNVQLPHGLTKKKRKKYIQEKKEFLESQMKNNCSDLEFRIAEFFLDLDSENDPVSQANFYRKQPGSNEIEDLDFEDIQADLEPFPFQLTKETTVRLLVFCKTENVSTDQLVEPQRIILDCEKNIRL